MTTVLESMERPGLDEVPPIRLFKHLGLEEWRWINFEGREQCPWLDAYLPSLPSEELQARISGHHGRAGLEHGYQIYRVVQHQLHAHGRPLKDSDRVLDFGCGWGRIIRFFLRDVKPENLWGIDVNEKAIDACLETNRWASFARNEMFPPTGFGDQSFALVYSYSVFSHLSERAHLAWLRELERILQPGGVFVATTLTRSNMESETGSIAAYDRGEYCFAEDGHHGEHFGFTAIPERYVRKQWSKHFEVHDYSMGPAQIVIVCRRR
jgi:SAM-dependent methyltransferase